MTDKFLDMDDTAFMKLEEEMSKIPAPTSFEESEAGQAHIYGSLSRHHDVNKGEMGGGRVQGAMVNEREGLSSEMMELMGRVSPTARKEIMDSMAPRHSVFEQSSPVKSNMSRMNVLNALNDEQKDAILAEVNQGLLSPIQDLAGAIRHSDDVSQTVSSRINKALSKYA